jgi:hypothetical protein
MRNLSLLAVFLLGATALRADDCYRCFLSEGSGSLTCDALFSYGGNECVLKRTSCYTLGTCGEGPGDPCAPCSCNPDLDVAGGESQLYSLSRAAIGAPSVKAKLPTLLFRLLDQMAQSGGVRTGPIHSGIMLDVDGAGKVEFRGALMQHGTALAIVLQLEGHPSVKTIKATIGNRGERGRVETVGLDDVVTMKSW